MMLSIFVVFAVTFHLIDIINFFLSSYFIRIEVLPVMLIFLTLILEDYKIYIASAILGVLFGAVDNKIQYYLILLLLITYILRKSKGHFLLDTPTFLFIFSFLFMLIKTIIYWIYVGRYGKLTSLLMYEYIFNILISALCAYPVFIFINKLYKAFVRLYEKSLHYA